MQGVESRGGLSYLVGLLRRPSLVGRRVVRMETSPSSLGRHHRRLREQWYHVGRSSTSLAVVAI